MSAVTSCPMCARQAPAASSSGAAGTLGMRTQTGIAANRGGRTIARAQTRPRPSVPSLPTGIIRDVRELGPLGLDTSFDEGDFRLRDVKNTSYVSRRRMDDADFNPDEVDVDGLPLVYNEARVSQYWGQRPGELAKRWANFVGISAPWLTSLANAFIQGRIGDEATQRALARDAVVNLEKLGPTFIKLGQILSIRPDVLPPAVMSELGSLQDRIRPFDTKEARRMVEEELGRPPEDVFSEFSEEPVAAASLAQVYRARVRETGQLVAVKVQRPGALATISKDLYVMRRAVGVYEKIMRRFTAQTTDYQELLSTYAEGLYTEMDFRNEALNAVRMRELLASSDITQVDGVVVPQPLLDLTTRRVLTMEWVTGVKLTTLPPEEIRALCRVGQEAFLVQLLEIGFFHGDPHPGNLLKITEGPDAGKLAVLDWGLVAEIPSPDREAMVRATIHLANRDWAALVDDFVALGFLPSDADRRLIIPVMDRVLSPYLRGGGARAFSFQMLSQDLLAATLEIPFSVPPYMSLLARSVATLEGIALAGDPNYQMVAQAFPFVVRKVLRNDSRGTALVLREILYDADGKMRPARLSSLLNAALGFVADRTDGFVDFDAVPDDGASTPEIVAFLLSADAERLRPWLVGELVAGIDLYARDRGRKSLAQLEAVLTPRLPFLGALPAPPPPPLFVPGLGLVPPRDLVEKLLPPLSPEDQVYLESLIGLAATVLGVAPADLDSPGLDRTLAVLLNPTQQQREVQDVLARLAAGEDGAEVAQDIAEQVMDTLVTITAERAGVPVSTLFPWYEGLRDVAREQVTTIRSYARTVRVPASAPGGASTPATSVGAQRPSEEVRVPGPELVAAFFPRS